MAGKRLSAGDMLAQGRARSGAGEDRPASSPGSGAASQRPDVETSRYERVTVYLTADQKRWARDAARDTGLDGIGASDVIRLALRQLRDAAQAGQLDLARELTEQAWTEVETHRGRAKRGLPPRPR